MKIEKLGSLHGNNIIWRYMSLEKFIDLILNRSIYFANARKMEDKFEMEIPINSLDERRRDYLERGKSSISVKINYGERSLGSKEVQRKYVC